MNTEDTLLAYSEWLDSEGLVLGTPPLTDDDRDHGTLVKQFIEQWESDPAKAPLCHSGVEMVVLYGDEQPVDVVVSQSLTPAVVRDLLLLVADDPYVQVGLNQRGLEVAGHWNVETLKAVGKWAASIHLRASDNDDVPVPPFPMILTTAFGWPVQSLANDQDERL